ncbi:hypothetical protein STEG23_038426, partial [Scotinomys teguina]
TTRATYVNPDPGHDRVTSPDMALSSSLGQNDTMALGGKNAIFSASGSQPFPLVADDDRTVRMKNETRGDWIAKEIENNTQIVKPLAHPFEFSSDQ